MNIRSFIPQDNPINNFAVFSPATLANQYGAQFIKLQIAQKRSPSNLSIPDGYTLSQWRVQEMDCPVEEGMLYQGFAKFEGVDDISCNLMQRILTIVHKPELKTAIEDKIRALGMTPQPLADGEPTELKRQEHNWFKLGFAGGFAVLAEVFHFMDLPIWLSALAAIISIGLCGLETYRKGWFAIRHGNLNINALMSVAVTGALLIGNWPEAAMVMFLFTVAEILESYSLDKARNAIQGLMTLTPEQATVRQPDGTWAQQEIKSIALNAIIRVKPGERIPLDGIITEGRSSVDQSPITGESIPVEKAPEDNVFAGTINQESGFLYRVTTSSENTTLARIIRVVEEAQGSKAPIQRFIDKFSLVYTPIVFAIAIAVTVIPPLFFGGAWGEWLYKGLVLLVIACPCALVISTPVTVVSGLTSAARRGILIKGGVYLELGRKLQWLALDKTGTLTKGKPAQTDFVAFVSDDTTLEVRQLAASLAGASDHPVSVAVSSQASLDGIELLHVNDFKAILGRGTEGVIAGAHYFLGNSKLMQERNIITEEQLTLAHSIEKAGKTVIFFANDSSTLALFAVADTVREESLQAISQLKALGVKSMMLTGDNNDVAQAIAQKVGIDSVHSELLPEEKLKIISEKVDNLETIGMVGDGINDAPALAKADIGFAMGGIGTDTAIETADVTLMDDDLRKIPDFIELSKNTYAILIQNISLAIGLKLIFLVLTLVGLGTMWMAVFADVGTTLIVILNGLRLIRKR